MQIRAWAALCILITLVWAAPSSSAPPGWPASLTIGSGPPGSVLPIYGEALAAILTEALGIPVSAQATQGPVQNILLIDSGTVQLGFVSAGTTLQSWNGTGAWTQGKQMRSMRALFPTFGLAFQVVVLKSSGIRSFADMAGKKIGTGAAGTTGGTYMPEIFKLLGIPATFRNAAFNVMGSQMQSHELDVMLAAVEAPTPAIAELARAESVDFIAPSDTEIATIRKAMPEFGVAVVPAGTYPSLPADYKTIGMSVFGVASKDLPDDLVYAIVKAFYANHDRLVKAHVTARESVVENAKLITVIPFHPGAARYYREIGVEIPDALAKSTAQ